MVIVRARWLGGAGVTLLCYPVLQMLGSVSHFLPWLPVAIAAFSALGLTLAYKKSKVRKVGIHFLCRHVIDVTELVSCFFPSVAGL